MIAVIDNYDSFTYNLVQYFGELGAEVRVFRNDAITVEALDALAPDHIVISPGPGEPADAGISGDVIRELGPRRPLLGVCLGHQCIGEVFGGQVVRAPRLVHGKTSPILHRGDGLFAGLPSPFDATRYHSLIVAEPLPAALEVTAFTSDGEVMGLRHRDAPHLRRPVPPGIDLDRAREADSAQLPGSEAIMNDLQTFIAKLIDNQHLTEAEAEAAMWIIMTGDATPAQIGGYLVALRMKGETAAEITGIAAGHARPRRRSDGDLRGRGAGHRRHRRRRRSTPSISPRRPRSSSRARGERWRSTAIALRHRKCGSADVLAALGVNLDLTPEQVGQVHR